MANLRKKGLTLLKIVSSAVLIYFVFTKIALQDVLDILKETDPWYLMLATLFFVISKLLSASRLNTYFHQLHIMLTTVSNLKLYLLGMFYNLFLPGGIGGDAYKGYLIKKKFGIPTRKIVGVLLIDRLSGLLLLVIYACLLAILMSSELVRDYKAIFGAVALTSGVAFWWIHKRFFPYLLPVFWKSSGYSAFVQLTQLFSAWCILGALGIEAHTLFYLFIFLLSSIVAVLPLTIGGIGSREIVFFYGASWLGLDQNSSVTISMVFFLITAVVSFTGILYHFKKPELVLKNKEPQ